MVGVILHRLRPMRGEGVASASVDWVMASDRLLMEGGSLGPGVPREPGMEELAYDAGSSKMPWRVVFNVSSSLSMSSPDVVRYVFWNFCHAALDLA